MITFTLSRSRGRPIGGAGAAWAHLPAFEGHDYDFYTSLLKLGMADDYQTFWPNGTDHSWISDRYGAQRLDHTLVSPAVGAITACNYDHSPRINASPTTPPCSPPSSSPTPRVTNCCDASPTLRLAASGTSSVSS